MLKLIYTDNGFHLEHLTQSLEDWVHNRMLLSLRAGTSFYCEPSYASFLLPSDIPYLSDLVKMERENGEILAIAPCDAEYVEVSLQGTWVTNTPDEEEGVFVCMMCDRAEFFLHKIWSEAQTLTSVTD